MWSLKASTTREARSLFRLDYFDTFEEFNNVSIFPNI
jgi:hypothetical protein